MSLQMSKTSNDIISNAAVSFYRVLCSVSYLQKLLSLSSLRTMQVHVEW